MPYASFSIWEHEVKQLLTAIEHLTVDPSKEKLTAWFHQEAVTILQACINQQAQEQDASIVFNSALQKIKLSFLELFTTPAKPNLPIAAIDNCYVAFQQAAINNHVLFINALTKARQASTFWFAVKNSLLALTKLAADALATDKPEEAKEGNDDSEVPRLLDDIETYINFQEELRLTPATSHKLTAKLTTDINVLDTRYSVFNAKPAPRELAKPFSSNSGILPIAPAFTVKGHGSKPQ